MANYKVPQDVEADDKLIGPFSFRQFVYLLIVAGMIALAWALSKLFLPLAVIPVPVILLFGALALPLRKDQPMEIYLAAIISFYLKPRVRTWDADGVESLIEITAPHVEEVIRSKNISREDAEQRFGYLANLVDSEGWAVRGQGLAPNTAMTTDSYLDAQKANDVLDGNNTVAQSFNSMIAKEDAKRREEAVAKMYAPPVLTTPTSAPIPTASAVASPYFMSQPLPQDSAATPSYNPYPNIQQMVIQPPADDSAHRLAMAPPPVQQPVVRTAAQPEPAAAPKPVPVPPPTPTPSATAPASMPVAVPAPIAPVPISAGIVNLANNNDLSIETIAREANRIHQKEDISPGEFTVSLR